MKDIINDFDFEPFVVVNNGEYHFCFWCWSHEGKETIESDFMDEKIIDTKFITTMDEYREYMKALENGNL
jgi:hypothetical protein